jgi:arabinofuranosyltransferase
VVSVFVVAGGLVHALYIVRVGGDFMHARMLLPTTFMVLLPVSVVAVRGAAWWLAAVIVAWALACALWLRPPYSAALATGESATTASDPFDPHTGIADERLFWVRLSGTAHPVTIDDYQPANKLARDGVKLARWAREGRRGLLLDISAGPDALVPLRRGVDSRLVVSTGSFGLFAYAAGDDVDVVDNHGLASVLAAQQRLVTRGRPGHEKVLPDAWVVAQFADPRAPIPGPLSAREVAAARRALACEPLHSVVTDVGRPLTLATAVDDATGSLSASRFRFPSDPIRAEREICGPASP